MRLIMKFLILRIGFGVGNLKKKKNSCTAKTVKGSHGEKIQQVLFTMQVLCLTLKIVHKLLPPKKLTQNQMVKNKFYAPENCLTSMPQRPFLFKKSLVCPLALAIHLAAEKETVKSSKVSSESASNGIKRLVEHMLKAFILQYSMSVDISLQG